jgi:hypothetical protein
VSRVDFSMKPSMAPPTPKIFTLQSISQTRSILRSPRGSTQKVPEIWILSESFEVVTLYDQRRAAGSKLPSSM